MDECKELTVCKNIELNTDVAISPENRKDMGLAWKICGFEIDASL